MIAVITNQWAKKEKFNQARELLDRNGSAQSDVNGFIDRTTMLSKEDNEQITSIVLWENDEIYDQWKTSAVRASIMDDAIELWSKSPESERFNVVNTTILPGRD